jgi:hypothetical protein
MDMRKKISTVGIIACAAFISACTSYNPYGYANYRSYVYEGRPLYPEVYEADLYYYKPSSYQERKQVTVPETYHVGAYRSPVSHRDQDKTWVDGQNPQGYTIELADKEKASEVAGKLQQVPKTDHSAAVPYEKEGKIYYKGVYGSYPDQESAQRALNSLPPTIKDEANVQTWGNVQNSVNN